MNGCELSLAVSAPACAIAKGKSSQQIALLAAFFTQLGDTLATIDLTNHSMPSSAPTVKQV